MRLSAVRFMDGGSGSFVGPHGLVLTNHHVAVGQLQKMSRSGRDYVSTGFYAPRPEDEIKCPDLELNVLDSMEEVTDKIEEAARGKSGEEAIKARRAASARIAKDAKKRTGLECEVINLYHGGEYWLYCYRKYTDVRLVFAPERQAAYFGGDHDNFTYPRHDLDFALFRVWKDGKPLKPEHYLSFNIKGAARGELVFVVGHPGRTQRLTTTRELEFDRDHSFPLRLEFFERTLAALREYSKRGPEQKRRALVRIFGFENAKKAYQGMYRTIKDPAFMRRRAEAEREFRKKVESRPEWKKKYARAWDDIAGVLERHGKEMLRRSMHNLWASSLAGKAITIVKLVGELEKPDADRLDGFHDAQLDRLKFNLFSPAPVYPDFEAVTLEVAIRFALDHLPADDPFARVLSSLGDPREAAERLCSRTKLVDPEFRKKLVEGGRKAVENCTDPLIVLARKLVPVMVEDEHWRKANVEAITVPAHEMIGQARFAVYGKDTYPDATFSLRMSYGTVRGYPMNGTLAPYKTTLYGLYDRALGFDRQGEWALPDRFWERMDRLDLSTPVNFVCDCDIIGGNSGSPVINRKAEVVGLVFDGNIESLAGRYFFDQTANRTVAVHTAYIIEALRKLYDAADLADELEFH
ncbi:MAG: S46 family peptidase [Deltaproteobacteria bacterium]|nr:MAG: S46 family peptidase [Deltaproteobacteria bacterium]